MAKRHPTRRRVPSAQREDADDVFAARVFVFSTWAKNNSQTLILVGVALVLAVGGLVYYLSYRSDLNRQAILELERVQQTVAFGLAQEAEVEIRRYIERFGGTRHATEAQLLLGQLHLTEGRPEQAVAVLEDAPRSGSDPIRIQARTLLGRAYEDVGRWQDAERQYLSAADAAQLDFERRDALADAARVRIQLGNHAGAAELYRRILDDLPTTHRERGMYEMRLAEVEHGARG